MEESWNMAQLSTQPLSSSARFAIPRHLPRCRSSVVEHSLGKGEVDSSILSGSTSDSRSCGQFLQAEPPPGCHLAALA